MLGRQGWSFLTNPDTLASRIFKASYFPRGDFLTAQLGHNPSFVWKSIWSSQSLPTIGSRWKIGDGTKVNTWHDPWLRDSTNFRIQTPLIAGMETLMVADLMRPGCKQWDVELITELFNTRDRCEILKLPLQEIQVADTRIWDYSKNVRYTVKSGYWVVSEIMSSNIHVTTSREWKHVWNLQIPPKVKTFLWRAIKDCLPVRATLQRKGILVPLTCVNCVNHIENIWHALLQCPFAQECWHESHLSYIINTYATKVESFADLIFLMMKTLTKLEVGKSVMIMWGLWKQRNDKLWNNKHCTSSQLVHGALQTLYDWLQAKERGPRLNWPVQMAEQICKKWHKPPPYFLKCNTDAAIFSDNNTFGLSSVLRDENGEFMACRVQHSPGNPLVKECEALALIHALIWIKGMNLTNVIFELDAKTVVDAIKSSDTDTTEFGSLVHQCRNLLNQEASFSVQFAYRQANVVADAMAKAAHCYASPSIYFESPSCLIEHLADYCNSMHD